MSFFNYNETRLINFPSISFALGRTCRNVPDSRIILCLKSIFCCPEVLLVKFCCSNRLKGGFCFEDRGCASSEFFITNFGTKIRFYDLFPSFFAITIFIQCSCNTFLLLNSNHFRLAVSPATLRRPKGRISSFGRKKILWKK